MSGVSPSRSIRLRAKTSELTDFFRGSGHSTGQPQRTRKDSMTGPSQNLEVPLSGDESATGTKKITRIPLFGRSRKKSNQSAASSPFASSCINRESSDGGEQSSASRGPSTDRRPSEPSLIGAPPPLPVPSKAPPSSLSSKFAARFSHSRSSKAAVSHTEPPALAPVVQSSGLHPPSDTRTASFESSSSAASKSRSTTPRPAKPTITVSLSPDNVEDFHDLFTRPTVGDRPDTSRTVRPNKESRNVRDPDTSQSNPFPSQHSRSPETSIYKRGHTPASAIAAAVRHRHTASIGNERPPSTSSKTSRHNSDSDKSQRNSGGSTPRLSEARESPRLVAPDTTEKNLPPSLGRRSSVAPESGQISDTVSSSSSLRSRMKHPAAPSRSKPPTMPLPLPPTPTTSPPTSPRLQHYNKESVSSSSSLSVAIRPRAHTISSGVNPSISLPSLSPTTTIKPTIPASVSASVGGETLDIDNASVEHLRQALKARNQQYDELATFVLKMTEAHAAEVSALEKKITTLEKDAIKLEKQVQGFTWMINGNEKDSSLQPKPLPPGILNQSRFAPSTTSNDSDREVHRAALPGTHRRLVYNSDSGAESHATSGAESLRASGASGSESHTNMVRKKLRRPYPSSDAYISSSLRSSKIPPGLAEKGLPDIPSSQQIGKRSSTSISPSSSTSSLLPPSPSMTVSSLSAIPEGPTSILRPSRMDSFEQQDDRRGRASNRISTSSMTSSSTAASSSYSGNIKRSRPPSIAQVLEKSPNMDSVLQKLRPFS